jgi:hypothetical protein
LQVGISPQPDRGASGQGHPSARVHQRLRRLIQSPRRGPSPSARSTLRMDPRARRYPVSRSAISSSSRRPTVRSGLQPAVAGSLERKAPEHERERRTRTACAPAGCQDLAPRPQGLVSVDGLQPWRHSSCVRYSSGAVTTGSLPKQGHLTTRAMRPMSSGDLGKEEVST